MLGPVSPSSARLKSCTTGRASASRPVAEREDGDLLAFEQLLDHDRLAERRSRLQGVVELGLVVADEDALSGREAVGLDHAGWSCDRQRLRSRNACRAHDVLGERLRAFDRARLRSSDRTRAPRRGEARRRRRRRVAPPARRRRGLPRGTGQREEALAVLGAHGMAAAERGDARVAGGGVELVEIRRLAELPRERVLASPRADQEHLHTRTLARGLDELPDRRTRCAVTAYDPPP